LLSSGVSHISRRGVEVERDCHESFLLFKRAADQGYVPAQVKNACFYENGTAVEKDSEEAFRLFESASKHGHEKARFIMAMSDVIHGSGEKFRLYKLAAEQGRLDAQFILATCYENGHGHLDAQFILATCYQKGHGVAKSLKKAFRIYKHAADQGDMEAQFHLALCYENGIGIEKSREDALALYKLAADQGFEEAQSKLDFYNDIEDASNEETNERDNRVETSSDASQNNLNISRAEKEEQTEQEKSREEGVAAKLKELELKEQSTGKREAMLKETEELLQEKHHHIKLIELEIATRVETVLSREKTVEAKEKEIQNSEEELQNWDLEMQEKEAELREKSNRLLAHEILWRRGTRRGTKSKARKPPRSPGWKRCAGGGELNRQIYNSLIDEFLHRDNCFHLTSKFLKL